MIKPIQMMAAVFATVGLAARATANAQSVGGGGGSGGGSGASGASGGPNSGVTGGTGGAPTTNPNQATAPPLCTTSPCPPGTVP